jgi:hypothetical protein
MGQPVEQMGQVVQQVPFIGHLVGQMGKPVVKPMGQGQKKKPEQIKLTGVQPVKQKQTKTLKDINEKLKQARDALLVQKDQEKKQKIRKERQPVLAKGKEIYKKLLVDEIPRLKNAINYTENEIEKIKGKSRILSEEDKKKLDELTTDILRYKTALGNKEKRLRDVLEKQKLQQLQKLMAEAQAPKN